MNAATSPQARGWTRKLAGTLAIAVAVLLPAACASTGEGPSERMAERLAIFERFAGPPVENFHFWKMDRFEVLGEYSVAVWTTIDDAFLITVDRPCSGLEFAQGISISSTQRRVHQRFDTVNFDNQRCRILQIRPVDGDALKDAQMAGEL